MQLEEIRDPLPDISGQPEDVPVPSETEEQVHQVPNVKGQGEWSDNLRGTSDSTRYYT